MSKAFSNEINEALIRLGLEAVKQDRLSGLQCLLKSIVDSTKALGCILWEPKPLARGQTKEATRLYVLADWFPSDIEKKHVIRHVIGVRSTSGLAYSEKESIWVEDVTKRTNPGNSQTVHEASKDFFFQTGINSLCSVPIDHESRPLRQSQLASSKRKPEGSERTPRVLTVYWSTKKPQDPNMITMIEVLGRHLVEFYRAVINRMGFNLIHNIEDILIKAEQDEGYMDEGLSVTNKKQLPFQAREEAMIVRKQNVLKDICNEIGDAFDSYDAAIILEDPLDKPETYCVWASCTSSRLVRTIFEVNPPNGPVGWSISAKRALRIFDLLEFKVGDKVSVPVDRNWNEIDGEPAVFIWDDPENIRERAIEQYNDPAPPPISIMVAPILGPKVFGVIRCTAKKKAPYFFGRKELELLQIAAGQISRCWSNWLHKRRMNRELEVWKEFVKGVTDFNSTVLELFDDEDADPELARHWMDNAVEAAQQVIPGVDIAGIRLLKQDQDGSEYLGYAAVCGKQWDRDKTGKIAKRFPIKGNPLRSSGVRAFVDNKLIFNEDLHKARRLGPYHEEFPEVVREIVVPIEAGRDRKYGVLDLDGTGDNRFTDQTVIIARLFAKQLGIYQFFTKTILALEERKKEARESQRKQARNIQDLGHQLRSPLLQGMSRAEKANKLQSALNSSGARSDDPRWGQLRYNLSAAQGLCRKAVSVWKSMKVLQALDQGTKIKIKRVQIRTDLLARSIREAIGDARLISERPIPFLGSDLTSSVPLIKVEFDDSTIEVFRNLEVDMDLIEQAINSLIDNAFKYSLKGTVIRIYGGLTGAGNIALHFENKGLRIEPGEVMKFRERGYRGAWAEAMTGEGSGIGLWIVEHIMKAHDEEAQLEIVPAGADGYNRFTLIFPRKLTIPR